MTLPVGFICCLVWFFFLLKNITSCNVFKQRWPVWNLHISSCVRNSSMLSSAHILRGMWLCVFLIQLLLIFCPWICWTFPTCSLFLSMGSGLIIYLAARLDRKPGWTVGRRVEVMKKMSLFSLFFWATWSLVLPCLCIWSWWSVCREGVCLRTIADQL